MAYQGDPDGQKHRAAFALAAVAIGGGLLLVLSGGRTVAWETLRILGGLLLIGAGAYGLIQYWRDL